MPNRSDRRRRWDNDDAPPPPVVSVRTAVTEYVLREDDSSNLLREDGSRFVREEG